MPNAAPVASNARRLIMAFSRILAILIAALWRSYPVGRWPIQGAEVEQALMLF
jgi:hypothetical protein